MNARSGKKRDRKQRRNPQERPPSAAEIAFPMLTFSVLDGHRVGEVFQILRPYWQQRPQLSPTAPGHRHAAIAMWQDGTIAAVPRNASLELMAELYGAARMVEAIREGGR